MEVLLFLSVIFLGYKEASIYFKQWYAHVLSWCLLHILEEIPGAKANSWTDSKCVHGLLLFDVTGRTWEKAFVLK